MDLSRRPVFVAVALGAAWLATTGTTAEGRAAVSRETSGGLHTAVLETPQGSIQVYLPDDLAAGDTISGTVSYTPSGRTDVEREENLAELRGYVVDVAEEPVADGPTWVRVLPELPGPTVVRFRGPRGTPVGEAPIPTLTPAELPPPPTSLEIPTFGQAGNPVEIGGPFSGVAGGTGVSVGGREAPLLAQSPRKTIARVPSAVVGPTTIEVERDGEVTAAPFRVLTVALSADKLDLQRGERTTLHLEVGGLAGLSEPVPLTLTNRSPQVVRLGSSEVERVTISPQGVSPNGTYRIDRPIQSLRTGGFAVNAVTGPAGITSIPIATAGGENAAQQEAPRFCRCTGIEVQADSTKPVTAVFDDARAPRNKLVTVDFPFTEDLKCEGDDRAKKCRGVLSVAARTSLWTIRKGTRPRPITASPAAEVVGIDKGKSASQSLEDNCPKGKGAAPHVAKTAIELPQDVVNYAGFMMLDFTPQCEGQPGAVRQFAVYVANEIGATSKVGVFDLSGFVPGPAAPGEPSGASSGESPPPCRCKSAEVQMKTGVEPEAKVTHKQSGGILTLEFELPATLLAECEGTKGQKCAGKVVPTFTAWTTESDNAEVAEGEFPLPRERSQEQPVRVRAENLLPAEIPCGACGEPVDPNLKLTYRVALRKTDTNQVKGSFGISFKPEGCETGREKAFAVKVDMTSSPPKVRVEARP